MDKDVAARDSALIRGGIAVLLGLLLAVTVWASAGRDGGSTTLVVITAVPFALVAAVGLARPIVAPLPARVAWLTTLTALWVLLAMQEAASAYLAIPLFVLYLHLLPMWWGIIATSVVMVVAAGLSVAVAGPSMGAVLGPVLSGLVAIAIGIAVEGIYAVSEDRRRLIDELIRTRGLLAESEREAGVVAERQRLAHEIHDTVAQGLSSIQMLLHAAERDIPDGSPAVDKLQLARHAAAENLRETRAMISALQPPDLEAGSLPDALRRLADAASGDGLDVSVDAEDSGRDADLPIVVEAVLLRIAQSAVSNVRHHSGATRARLTLSTAPGTVRLDIVDDGRGFDVDGVMARLQERAGEGHIGLSTMQRRAADIGGTVEFESTPGHGAAVAVSVPLESETDPPTPTGDQP
ncbi:MAG: sensor histidine kinase [Corynebacterium sp.]|uniref:sensor histidine kinase n=1 Tax=Corynebacterium sp. TaxID=1720 RepID=UPI003F9901F4